MNTSTIWAGIRLPTAICFTLFLFCASVFAEEIHVGAIYTDQPDELSFIVELSPGLDAKLRGAEDFQLIDVGNQFKKTAAAIESFSTSNRKIVLLIAIDVSRSINKRLLKETQEALIDNFSNALPNNRFKFGLISFADDVNASLDFTDNLDLFSKSVRELKIAKGNKTVLYQAMIESLKKLNNLNPSEYRRLVIISDGKNEGGNETLDSVVKLSKALDIPIDAIGWGIIERQYADSLNGLAEATGGSFIYPKLQKMSLKEAVNKLKQSLINNTWIVNFKYNQDLQKPKLENPIISFKGHDSANIAPGVVPQERASSDTTGGITQPRVTPNRTDLQTNVIAVKPNILPSNNSSWIEKFKNLLDNKLFFYVVLVLALLSTIALIVWLVLRRKEQKDDSNEEPIATTTDVHKPITTPESKEKQKRETIVDSVFDISAYRQGKPSLQLLVLEGSLKGHKFPLDKKLFRIGANQDNDLILADEFISGKHAFLEYKNNELILTDLHSRNGTYLNGELIKDKSTAVFSNDIIRVGNISLKIIE